MSLSVYISIHWITNMWVQLIVGSLVGALSYLLCCKIFNIIDEDMLKLVKAKLGRK